MTGHRGLGEGLRVLHVHTRYRQRGGEASVVDSERRLLLEGGYNLSALDFENPTSSAASIAALAQAPWNHGAVEQTVAEARRHRADVVHIHNTWFALSPAVIVGLRRAGFPVVATFHNYRPVCVNAMLFREGAPCEVCVGRSTLPGVRYRCYRDSFVASAMASLTVQLHRLRGTWAEDLSAAIVLTEFAKQRLVEGGLPPDRTIVKPNFVGDPGVRTTPPSVSNEVIFVGRLTKEKGIDRLLAAWPKAQLDGLELRVIGDAADGYSADGADEGIQLLGRLKPESVKATMLRSRALIVPSVWYEGQPMVILEALAAGLPVLHTDLGALGETSGSGGLLIGAGGVHDMASALGMLTDGELMDRLGANARHEFEERFSERSGLEALGRIYCLAMGQDSLKRG